jgi:HAD superfamily hydrolase (TIGR01509 family)
VNRKEVTMTDPSTDPSRPWHIPAAGRSFGAALFDLDGVLTPTAQLHQAAWRRLFDRFFGAHGITPPYADADYFEHIDGRPRYDAVRAVLASRAIAIPEGAPSDAPGAATVCGLGNLKDADFAEALSSEGIAPYAGSVALLDALSALDVPSAVVSSSRNAISVLDAAGLGKRFEVVVDGLVAEREALAGKPAPATFLRACQLLDAEVDHTVVVEDALSGVVAGKAGGFGLVVGIDRGAGADDLRAAGADIVVDDLAELVAP